jgi:hypothetical protein
MSLTAVRKLTVVSFFVIGGLLISGNLFAGTAPYSALQYSHVQNEWGTTFDDKPYNYNKGMYYTGAPGDPNRNYGDMPQEDTTYIHEINAPFDMQQTSWSATTDDLPQQFPQFQTYNWPNCTPSYFGGVIYAMNDTDHVYIALEAPISGVNSADRLNLYFDPDNVAPVPEFVEGSGYKVGVRLGNVTDWNEGGANIHDLDMDTCNGHWKDWDNSGSIDTWEAGYPWPRIGDYNQRTYPTDLDSGNKEDLTICPRNVALWGDGSENYPVSGAYWANPGSMTEQPIFTVTGKTDIFMMQFKIPLEHLGCSIALGSDIGFAIEWLDDMHGELWSGNTPGDGGIDPCTTEDAWWPTDIEDSGNPGAGWEKYDAAFMGTMTLSSLNVGNRLWGPWYDVQADRTSYLVLKNPGDSVAKTKVKFYQSLHGDQSERWAPLPGAGELVHGSQCLEIPPHGVSALALEEIDEGALDGTKGCIEVTNIDLAGYVVSYIGLDSGALQRYAWSVDLIQTPLTPTDWETVNGMTTTGMLLSNKWYIVGEPGWDFNTSIVIVNPNPANSATARITLFPANYWDPEIPTPTPALCATGGFHPDFDGDYSGTSACGDDTGDPDDVINLPPHQAVELRMFELLNYWVAHWNVADVSREITDPLNTYWHFRKGTVEIQVNDGDDTDTDRMNEVLFGVTARESAFQGWAEELTKYYE